MKVIKVLGVVLLLFLGVLFVLPYFFKDKVKEIIETETSSLLNAQLYIGDFSLGFFSNFPNATITLKDFGLVGVDSFANDTLLDVEKLNAVVNLTSLFKDSYKISKIELVRPTLNAIVNADSLANWDIVVEDSLEVMEEEESAPLKLNLKKFTVEDLKVTYASIPDSMSAAVENVDLNLKGDLAFDIETLADIKELKLIVDKIVYEDNTTSGTKAVLENVDLDFNGKVSDRTSKLKLLLGVDSISVAMAGVPYLNKAVLNADIDMEADLDSSKFVFADNYLKLNEIQANFEGFVQIIDSLTTNMDIKLKTPSIDFKQILSLIPAIYSKEFETIQTSGAVSLNAVAKGIMQGDTLPMIDADLKITDAMFKYPDLPSSMKQINIDAKVTNPGGATDLTEVNVSKFNFTMAENPFAMTLDIKTPVSDPDFSVSANGVINLGTIKDVIHLEDLDLKGILTAALKANGKMSYVDNERYELFSIDGDLKMNEFVLKTPSLDYDVKINEADLGFTSQYLNMNADIALGGSDLALSGKVQNFIQYVMRGETLKGNMNIKSKLLDTNELLGASEDVDSEEPVDESSSVAVPANLDFAVNLAVDQLKYGAINIQSMMGDLYVKDAVAQIKSLSANTMGGSVNVAGKYDTKDTLNPNVDVNLNVKNMNISEVFSKVRTAKKMVPLLSDAEGKFSMNMDFASKMDATLSPVMNTINAKGKFMTKEVALKNAKVFNAIADKVKLSALNDPKLKDVSISFAIKDGRLYADPFETKVSTAILNFSGSSGLDKTLDYVSTIKMPKSISNAVDMAFDLKIGGTFKDPKFTFSVASMVEQVKEKVTEVMDQAKQKAIAEATAQKEKLVAAAKASKEKMVSTAKISADKVIAEAEAQAAALQAKATNPIAKAAAKKSGDALISKARTQANKIIADAEANGNKMITDAETKGDAMIKKASETKPGENK